MAAFLLVPAAQACRQRHRGQIAGSGSGEVSSVGGFSGFYEGSPPIECSGPPSSGTCETELVEEEEISPGFEAIALHAVPAPGSEFTAWVITEGEPFAGGCGSNETKECVAGNTGENNLEITAVFEEESEAEEFPLTVTLEGTGEGTVTSTPAGINCGSECEAEFEEGEEVELSQSAETGSEFIEWGGACSGSGSCEVTMDEAQEVTATFDLEPTPEFPLSVTKSGTGSGKVTSSPAGIDCGATCTAEFEEGEEINSARAPPQAPNSRNGQEPARDQEPAK